MRILLRGLRVLVGVVAVWQCIGLLPVLTWLPKLNEVTIGMVGMVIFKAVILTVCIAAFYWLGILKRKRGPQQEKMNDFALAGIVLLVGVVVVSGIALLVPSHGTDAKLNGQTSAFADAVDNAQQPQLQMHNAGAAVGILPYEQRAWSGSASDQFSSVQAIEAKARSIPQLNTQRAWAAVIAWQAFFMDTDGRDSNVALYMGVDSVLEGIKSHAGICRPGEITIIDAQHASPGLPAGSKVAWDDCQ